MDQAALMLRIRDFLKKSKMTKTRFGREAVNDPRLINDLARGRVLGEKRIARIAAYIDAQEAYRREIEK